MGARSLTGGRLSRRPLRRSLLLRWPDERPTGLDRVDQPSLAQEADGFPDRPTAQPMPLPQVRLAWNAVVGLKLSTLDLGRDEVCQLHIQRRRTTRVDH